jgi:hypothetical protein
MRSNRHTQRAQTDSLKLVKAEVTGVMVTPAASINQRRSVVHLSPTVRGEARGDYRLAAVS